MNFRDVHTSLSLLTEVSPVVSGCLLRGGKLEGVVTWEEIACPRTILSFRGIPDEARFPAVYRHLPLPNDNRVYDTKDAGVRRWLRGVLGAFVESEGPVLVHCTSGKDRTGVVVAALLRAAGVAPGLIVEEYLLSEGRVQREWMELALGGMPEVSAREGEIIRSRLRSSSSGWPEG